MSTANTMATTPAAASAPAAPATPVSGVQDNAGPPLSAAAGASPHSAPPAAAEPTAGSAPAQTPAQTPAQAPSDTEAPGAAPGAAAAPAPTPVPAPAPVPAPTAGVPAAAQAGEPAASVGQALLGWVSGLSLGGAALALAGGLLGSGITLGAMWLATPSQRPVATVDLQSVIELQQLKLTAMVLKPGATDDDRARAYTQVKAFGGALDDAIERVRKSCNCVLLTRSAVVGAHGLDMTPMLKSELRLDGADADAWRRIAGEGIGKALPAAETTRANLAPAQAAEAGGRK